MKLSLNWLNDFVELDKNLEAKEIADKLSTSGFEIEEVLNMGCDTKGVVIGYVKACKKHPNADKLNICQVDIGSEVTQIICGAPNVCKGIYVPVATIGTNLESNFLIKKAKIRGEESNGMICSEAELGISHEADGIMVLNTAFPTGTSISKYFTNVDIQFDLAITANRPDCLNHIGIAKELSVIYNVPFNDLKISKKTNSHKLPFKLKIEEDTACQRFTVSVIKGLKINESPKWLKDRLTTVGLRPINNLVDISNYIMFEIGQPMHFYDYDRIDGAELNIRVAEIDEIVTTLDNKERKLTRECTVIENKLKFAGIAGIMGGQGTEVTETTTTVLIEAAIWDRVRIQHSQRDLTLTTDASYRYSKGVDYNLPPIAQQRAIDLILNLCGGELVGKTLDFKSKELIPHLVPFRKERCDKLLGKAVDEIEIERIFTGLSFIKNNKSEWKIPTNRQDITREVDLIEEIARIIGLNRIEGRRNLTIDYKIDEQQADAKIDALKEFLAHKGVQEVITNSMVSSKIYKKISQKIPVQIVNPINDECDILRTVLALSVIKVADFNIKHKRFDIACFEINKEYQQKKNKVIETKKLVIVFSGRRNSNHWSEEERNIDFYDLKGLLEELLKFFGLSEFSYSESDYLLLGGESQKVTVKSNPVAYIGKLDSRVKHTLKLSQDMYILELNLEQLLSLENKKVKKIKDVNRFPVMERDIAVLVDKSLRAADMIDAIKLICGDLLESVSIFDLYQDKSFAKNEHSMAFKLLFSANRTLRDNEVDPLFHACIEMLGKQFNANLRDG